MKFLLNKNRVDREEVVYFDLRDDGTHIDLIAHTPNGDVISVLGIRKRTGQVIAYAGVSDGNTGLVLDENGHLEVEQI